MHQAKLSLIGTSRGERPDEVVRLLKSLPKNNDYIELIFVDQSNNEEINDIFSEYIDLIKFKLIKSGPCSLSTARNIALAHATGNILGFCDDDAFYNEEAIEYLLNLPVERVLLSVPVKDFATNSNYANRKFPSGKCKLGYLGVIRYSLSVGTFIFLGRGEVAGSINFDERLGAGTSLGGSEETDLFFRLIFQDYGAFFDPNICVFHDNDNVVYKKSLAIKYEQYAIGYAVVIKRNLRRSRFLLLFEVFRVIIRCLVGLSIPSKRSVCFHRLKGFIKGMSLNLERSS